MRVLRVDPARPQTSLVREAADVIRRGGTVAFPTETVYGLGANALDSEAVARIFAAKERPGYNPLIVHCPDLERARSLAAYWPEAAQRLAEIYWPGPLTLVVRKREIVPDLVTAGLPTVALRVPDHPVAAALLAASDTPIAAPSANRFMGLSPTTAEHVAKGLSGRIDLVLDGGPTGVGIESTVVDLTGTEPVLLRPGSITRTQLEATLGREILTAGVYTGEDARPAPGMTRRHYSPRATLRLFPDRDSAAFQELADRALEAGERVAAIVRTPLGSSIEHVVHMPPDAAEYARSLYAVLHELDDQGYDTIFVEAPPDDPEWSAIRDRLTRASSREAP